eukprot:gene12819-15043_t
MRGKPLLKLRCRISLLSKEVVGLPKPRVVFVLEVVRYFGPTWTIDGLASQYYPPHRDQLEVISHPISYEIRPQLSQRHYIKVIEEPSTGAIAAYGCNIKSMRVNGKKVTVFYIHDMCVNPDYRNLSISAVFFNHVMQTMKSEKSNTILFGSTFGLQGGGTINKRADNLNAAVLCDQLQAAWRLDGPVTIKSLPLDSPVTIWKEYNPAAVKSHWTVAFRNHNFTAYDFNDILLVNSKYHETTYIAQLTFGGQTTEASISVWNQDLIFDLRSRSNQPRKHRQLYSCYAIGPHSSMLFDHLLQHVHNDQYEQGVSYLFAGYDKSDPIAKHFPLLPGIKCMDFVARTAFVGPTADFEEYRSKLSIPGHPTWNDPRDYGVLLLYPETSTSKL